MPHRPILCALLLLGAVSLTHAHAPQEPQIGQPGKDVIWVPTPPELIDAMFDLAGVTRKDYVVDLGSGDGRVVIAAARRGAKALGVEYDAVLVERSREAAKAAGVGSRATFLQGDMYTAEFSRATVLALFLLPTNLGKLRDQFLALTPGTRIVINTFGIPDWRHDKEVSLDVCDPWCSAKLWIVPARVAGTWKTPEGVLTLTQSFQQITGSLTTPAGNTRLSEALLRGDQIRFRAGDRTVTGTIRGTRIEGTLAIGGRATRWRATRTRQ
ncbi:MAG: class I SAM-dependent methyltransferase [Vicinamibacterales bacterium]